MRIAVPSYFWPGADWDRMIAAKPALVVINPDSGPGDSVSLDYREAVKQCAAAKVPVLGYIATTWGGKSIADVKAERFAYKTFYRVKNFFYDEGPTQPQQLQYCRRLIPEKAKVTFNPGTFPDSAFAKLKATLMVYECPMDRYLNNEPPAWVFKCPPNKFWHCVTDVPTLEDARRVMDIAKGRNAGFVWITDDTLPNEYDTLPPYYEDMAAVAQ